MKDKYVRLCIIGFGNAAKAFCKILNEKREEIEKNYGYKVIVTAVAGRSKGNLLSAEGIELNHMIASAEATGKLSGVGDAFAAYKAVDIIEKCEADVMVELSTLSISDGQPAIGHIEKAFDKGMHVITANKGPIAWDFDRLNAIADKNNRIFLYETTVMDGTPIFNLVRETLPGCKVLSFKGILNSTTNFILEEMENGAAYEDAVKEAQRRGFAEADPSLDVDGWDAAAKTTAIANVIMKAKLKPTDIDRTGISGIDTAQIKEAAAKNKKIKLLCEGYIENGKAAGKVHPVLIDRNDLFSTIDATSSILSITTDMMGEMCIIEKNPEIEQTAYGIYSDLLTLLKRLKNE